MDCQACSAPLVRVYKSWHHMGSAWAGAAATRRRIVLRCPGCLLERDGGPWRLVD